MGMTPEEAYRAGYQAGRLLMPEIVRCKDCRWGDWTKNIRGEDMIFCYNGDTGIEDGYLHEPDWYCAEGEHRD